MRKGINNMNKPDRRIMQCTVFIVMFVMLLLPMPVYAAEVTSKLNSLYDLVLNIVTGAGVIVLAWGVFEFAMAYQSHDSAQQTMSLKKVVAGIIMVGAPQIVSMLK